MSVVDPAAAAICTALQGGGPLVGTPVWLADAPARVWRWGWRQFAIESGDGIRWLAVTDATSLWRLALHDGQPGDLPADDGLVRSPLAGLVVHWVRAVGDAVSHGDILAIIETMKIEVPVPAPCGGTLAELLATEGSVVQKGSVLARMSPARKAVSTPWLVVGAVDAPAPVELLRVALAHGGVPIAAVQQALATLDPNEAAAWWHEAWTLAQAHTEPDAPLSLGQRDARPVGERWMYPLDPNALPPCPALAVPPAALVGVAHEPALAEAAERWWREAVAGWHVHSEALQGLLLSCQRVSRPPEGLPWLSAAYFPALSPIALADVAAWEQATDERARLWLAWTERAATPLLGCVSGAGAAEDAAGAKRRDLLGRGIVHPSFVAAWMERDGFQLEEWTLTDAFEGVVWSQERPRVAAGVAFGVLRPVDPANGALVVLLSDPTRQLGSLSDIECRVVEAALVLAEQQELDLAWFATSSGARIDMRSGTENLDGTARALRRLVAFSRGRQRVYAVAVGPCVGAQAYWLAAATVALGSRGRLWMTPRGSLVLSGRRALEVSGGEAGAPERSFGGVGRLGPMGAMAYAASSIPDAWRHVLSVHRSQHVPAPGPDNRGPLEARAWQDGRFATVGEIFANATNPGRRAPWALAPLMQELLDPGAVDWPWAATREARQAVVAEGRLAGVPVTLIGVSTEASGPEQAATRQARRRFAGSTLYPASTRKLAQAIHGASGRRPVIVLANMAGFDGSPASLADGQLESGAQLAAAVAGCESPILVVVLTRYHGGAFVVFSRQLNPRLRTVALEGSQASVIGGGAAATVVFGAQIDERAAARGGTALDWAAALKEIAREFDAHHSVERARDEGSIDAVVPLSALRATLETFVRGGKV